MERAARHPGNAWVLIAGAVVSAAAGLALVRAAAVGLEWHVAVALAGGAALAVAWSDVRLLLGLFAASFLTIAEPALRLKIGGLWGPVPAVIALALCARELVRRWSAGGGTPLGVPVVAVFALAIGLLASGAAAERSSAYAAELVKWAMHGVVFVAMCVALERPGWVARLADGLTAAVALLASYGLVRVFAGWSYDIDVFEGVATRNAAAFYITAVLPLAYARVLRSRGVRMLGGASVLAVLVAAQVYTFTRAAWIASACGLLFVAGRRVRAYVLIGLAALLLVAVAPQPVRDRFQTLFVAVDYSAGSPLSSSTVVRQHLLQTGVRMVGDNWLLGVGLGNYWDNYHRYAVPGAPPVPNIPHNYYVLLWAEGGLLSLAGFLWLYGSRLWGSWRGATGGGDEVSATLVGLAGSLVAMAVEACFSNDLNILITWTVLGMATACARMAPREAA